MKAITQVNTQSDEMQGMDVRSMKRAQTSLSLVQSVAGDLLLQNVSVQPFTPLFHTQSAGTPSSISTEMDARHRLHQTMNARPRLSGRMNLRPALRRRECSGEMPNGKQDAYRFDPPGRDPGCRRERKPG
ncbi:MAG: hypothetical protein V4441_10555 [Pseudomonadota bacterium]